MTNAYIDLKTFKSAGVLDISGSTYDSRLLAVLEGVSRWIDLHCDRHFYVLQTSRTFDGDGGTELLVPDLINVTSLKTDDDKDRVYETTWASSDYLLYPQNADPTEPWGRPFTRLVVDTEAGNQDAFPKGFRTSEVQGKWGYREELETSAASVDGSGVSASGTTFGVDDGTQFSHGQTILIDSEQMYVTFIATNTLTVVRGANGTTAASHAALASIKVYKYPAGISEACLVQSARLWRRKDAGFVAGESTGLDPDVRRILSPYRRAAVGTVT